MTEYEIFKECFPQLTLSETQFETLLNKNGCKQILRYENGELAGFAYIYRSCLRVMCVAEKYRGKGIGSSMLEEAEEMIKGAGYSGVTAGGLDSALFIGEVISEEQFRAQGAGYLGKHGYIAKNGCVEMVLDMDKLSCDIPFPDETEYGIYSGSRTKLLEAVEKIDPDWIEYFRYADTVFAAWYKGQLAGACILGYDDTCLVSGDGFKTGNIGCVGVVPEMRRNGVGLSMVAKAAQLLKEKGCRNAFIHYTHLEKWYGKIGAEAVVYCAFSSKKFIKDQI